MVLLFSHFSLFTEYVFFLTTTSQSPNAVEVEAGALLKEKRLNRVRQEIPFCCCSV